MPVPHPDPEIKGGEAVSNEFFWPFGPQFGLKIRGAGSPGPSSGSPTESRRSSAQEGRATKPQHARIEGASVPIFESFA